MKQNITNKPVNAVTVFGTWMNIACHYCYCFHYYFVFTTVYNARLWFAVGIYEFTPISLFGIYEFQREICIQWFCILLFFFCLFIKKPSNTSNEIMYHTWRTPLGRVRSRAHYAFCLYDFWWWLFISFNRDFLAPFWYIKSRPILLLWSACAFDLV